MSLLSYLNCGGIGKFHITSAREIASLQGPYR